MSKFGLSLLLLIVFLAALPLISNWGGARSDVTYHDPTIESPPPNSEPMSSGVIESAYQNRQSNFMVEAAGSVANILSDDLDPPRHQRFIVRLSTGHLVLIAHNIDIAYRIPDLKIGDVVQFLGEYEWNENGGTVHWTHHDPAGRHMSGHLIHEGRRYSSLGTSGTDFAVPRSFYTL